MYMDVSAIFMGIDPRFTFYLVSVANATSGFGRLLSGLLSDRVGMQYLTAEGGTYTEQPNDRCH